MTKSPTQANGSVVRGRPFPKGQSGNPKGRPKGARTKPVELTVDQEVERLKHHATELAIEGQTEPAIDAFEKMLILAWGAGGNPARPGKAREKARELVALIERENRVDILRNWYDDSDAEFFQHVGLPADASWDQWRAHYATDDDDVDMERVGEDLKTFPPIAARIAELTAEQEAGEQRQ